MNLPDDKRLLRGRAAVIDCRDEGCSICLSVCGFSAIKRADGLPYSDPAKCIGCGGCMGACPGGYIKLYKDRGDGTYEVSMPFDGELPEIDESFGGGRVIQAIPARGNGHGIIRIIINKSEVLS